MRSSRPLAASGLSNFPDNPTPPPDDGLPFSSGIESIVGSATRNPTITNTLLMLDTPAIVGFVGFCEKV